MKTRILSLAMSIIMAVSMSVPAFALTKQGGSGTGNTTSMNYPPLIYANGKGGKGASNEMLSWKDLPKHKLPIAKYEEYGYLFYGGTFNVGVGETITLRLLQDGLTANNKVVGLLWDDEAGGIENVEMTNMSAKKLGKSINAITMSELPKQKVTSSTGDTIQSPYLEYSFKGVSEGVFEVFSNSPYIGNYSVYQIVVGKVNTSVTEKSFELKKLQSAVKSATEEYNKKQLIETRLTTINNQLIYLNKELATGKKPANIATVKTALNDADKLLKNLDKNFSKLSVYAKADTAQKTDKAALDATQKKLDTVRKNLDKALKSIG